MTPFDDQHKPSGDPPEVVPNGPDGDGEEPGAPLGHDRSGAPPFRNFDDPGTLWDVVVDSGDADTHENVEWMIRVSQDREMRAAMNLRAIDRLRDELDKTPGNASPGDPVVLRAGDAVLIARMLLKRFA